MKDLLLVITLALGMLAVPVCPTLVQAGIDTSRVAVDSPVTSSARFPWYDAESGELRPIPVAPAPPLTGSPDWVQNPPAKSAQGSSARWESIWNAIQYIVWIALGGLLLWLAVYWARSIIYGTLQQPADAGAQQHRHRHEADSIERLPFSVQRPQTDLLNEARRHYEAQDYRSAIVYLFSYQLTQLDQNHLIQLAKGKTNRQYLVELRSAPTLQGMLTQTMLVFEDVFFGHYPLKRERFESCWLQLAEFDRLTERAKMTTR